MQISNEEYKELKPLLFSLGYRLLGSVTEAEDLVQETFLKAYQLDEHEIANKKAYLCKMMTHRCLDVLKSASKKREHYIGPWLPEPLLTANAPFDEPAERALQKEGLSIAYLRMMEHLTPQERAVFLLRQALDFSYQEISTIIEKKEENCRKLFSRAKGKLANVEKESLSYERNKRLVNQFVEAFRKNHQQDLLNLISDKVTLYTDGGGKVKAALRPILSRDKVLAFLSGIAKKFPKNFSIEETRVNGQPALACYVGQNIHAVVSFLIQEERLHEIYIIMNPEKLPKL